MEDVAENGDKRPPDAEEQAFMDGLDRYRQSFIRAMDDDLNTADALGAVFEMVRAANGFWIPAVPRRPLKPPRCAHTHTHTHTHTHACRALRRAGIDM